MSYESNVQQVVSFFKIRLLITYHVPGRGLGIDTMISKTISTQGI